MTTEALRKVITVTAWSLTDTGLTISYTREDSNPKILHIILSPLETLQELSKVGSIEDINEHAVYHFPELSKQYKMCQWEALSIAIRHEEEKQLANDMNFLEMDSALSALIS